MSPAALLWTVSVDEQHFYSALWTVADVDLFHVLLTRQEGYKVVSGAALVPPAKNPIWNALTVSP